jgi:hypothetical protein
VSTPNPVVAPSTSVQSEILAVLKQDVFGVLEQPLLTFLTALSAAQGDRIKIAAAFLQFEGNLAPALPAFIAELEQQLAAWLTARIEANAPKP